MGMQAKNIGWKKQDKDANLAQVQAHCRSLINYNQTMRIGMKESNLVDKIHF